MAASSSRNDPTTRSRTGLFLAYRSSAVRATPSARKSAYDRKGKGRALNDGDDEERMELLERNGDAHVDMDGTLPPAWADLSDQVDEILAGVKPKIANLDRLHAKHVLPSFTDRTAQEREIEALTTDITGDFRVCHKHIQRIARIAKDMSASPTMTAREALMAQNVQTAMATKVQEISSTFRKKQSVYLQQLRGHEIRNQDIMAASGAGPWKDSFAALEDDMQLSKTELQSQAVATETTDASTAVIAQRDREVTGIAQSIAELAEIFKDLSSLVIDQGTMLDRIDYNVEQMASHITGAVTELETATKYQKRSGKRQTIFLLILLIFGAILVLVYKPRRSATVSPPPPLPPPLSGQPGSAADALRFLEAQRLRVYEQVPPFQRKGRRRARPM